MKAYILKASWCVPCKTLGPKIKSKLEELGLDFEVLDVDVDLNEEEIPYPRSLPSVHFNGTTLPAKDLAKLEKEIKALQNEE